MPPAINRLHPDNCNKQKCKNCIFGENPIQISPARMDEIRTYLATGKNSHICHTTNKTCYGALAYQSEIFHRLNIIEEPTVACLLETAGKILSFGK